MKKRNYVLVGVLAVVTIILLVLLAVVFYYVGWDGIVKAWNES